MDGANNKVITQQKKYFIKNSLQFILNSAIRAFKKVRGVAQPGRVLGLGPRCRMFESCHPDHYKKAEVYTFAFFVI